MSHTVDTAQFKDMLANYMGESVDSKVTPPQRKRGQVRVAPSVREAPVPSSPSAQSRSRTILEEVDASILMVKKGVNPRKVAHKLLGGKHG